MKKILGLDLGTNSIGWALINQDDSDRNGQIIAAGSRIIPMSQDILGKFDSGQSISQTAERTAFRGMRRLRERHLLRRERLHRVLNILGFLPEHYAKQIDFQIHFGQFIPETEPKLAYSFNLSTNKPDFIFKKSFDEMLQDFAEHQPELVKDSKKVPYDWTIYYLRKKALTEKIEKEELAWLLLHFNQKRGYYQLRGEDDEENTNKLVEFYSLAVSSVIATDDRKSKDEIWYDVHLENGWIYRRTSKTPLDWVGKTKEFIVTTDINDDGTIKKDKSGKEKRSFRAPDENDWTLVKKKTEYDIDKSNKTVGTFIYENLLQNPNQKIKGKLVRVIERKFYKIELETILKKQQEFHEELNDVKLYQACLEELYQYNDAHKNSILQKDIPHLFLNDILYYQRPLKSKKSLISNCKYECRSFIRDGKKETEFLKCIAKSHPLFQEFRLWQFIQNLKIYQREKNVDGKWLTDVNVTDEFLKSEEDWVTLFDWLNDREEVEQKNLLKQYFKIKNIDNYRWNYVEDKAYPCNETRSKIAKRLKKMTQVPDDFLNKENEEALWHILYSVEDKYDIEKALKTFAAKNSLGDDFVELFRKFPPFEKDYGSYSAKAIKKLLPLMRMGKCWNESNIDLNTQNRIGKIINAEYDETIKERVREKSLKLTEMRDFRGLALWLASYVVYDRHSEDSEALKWKTADGITLLKQHSLRNPIVEQVINETLQVVKDIWKQYGRNQENFFLEIHIELGREMKNPANKRKQMTDQITENENSNLRIKALLMELLNDSEIENVRPYSPNQQEILKIYEDGVLNSEENIPDDILKIAKQAQPTTSELTRYKLWLQQKYRSPYTGEVIPLNKLFTRAYDIEHIIPQSRFFDDSFSNKVICEVEVNKDKDNCTAYEYIKGNRGKKIELSFGKTVTLFSIEQYEEFVKNHFAKSGSKMKKLLMDEIPEAFIQRQLNDTRYISKVVKNLMSNIVREDGEQEAISKNVIASNGSITSTLKQDWGLNDIWNDIITPRFERLNDITKSKNFGDWTNKDGKKVFQAQVPLELSKGFSKKRIDHRHHALDAIVIACASRSHINYLNNESALSKGKPTEERDRKRHDLKHKLCFKKYNDNTKQNYTWVFRKPWETFTQDAKEILNTRPVSFKQNLRVTNNSVNQYQSWKDENGSIRRDKKGNPQKGVVKQATGKNVAVRKPMHDPMPYGKVVYGFDVLEISKNVGKWETILADDIKNRVHSALEAHSGRIADTQSFLKKNPVIDPFGNAVIFTQFKLQTEKYRKRQPIGKLSAMKTIDDAVKFIYKVADIQIQNALFDHLRQNEGNIDKAFSPDGLETFNSFRKIPVYALPIAEKGTKRFSLGNRIGTKHKWVEATDGTNLFFAIYSDEHGKRLYETVPLNVVIERQKQGDNPVPDRNEKGHKLEMYLSPNDLVYVPSEDEREHSHAIDFNCLTKERLKRIYKFVSCTDGEGHFVPNTYSKAIVKNEMGANNKSQNALDGTQIKAVCIKLNIDRLGNVKPVL